MSRDEELASPSEGRQAGVQDSKGRICAKLEPGEWGAARSAKRRARGRGGAAACAGRGVGGPGDGDRVVESEGTPFP